MGGVQVRVPLVGKVLGDQAQGDQVQRQAGAVSSQSPSGVRLSPPNTAVCLLLGGPGAPGRLCCCPSGLWCAGRPLRSGTLARGLFPPRGLCPSALPAGARALPGSGGPWGPCSYLHCPRRGFSLSASLDFTFLPPSALPLILQILTRLISRTLRAFRKVGPRSVQHALLWSVFIEYLLHARRWGRG